jgi:hypothetical protein
MVGLQPVHKMVRKGVFVKRAVTEQTYLNPNTPANHTKNMLLIPQKLVTFSGGHHYLH